MKVIMLRSKMGSDDGFTTKLYEEGQTYDVSDALAESFIGEQLAEPAPEGGEKAEAPLENKAAKAPKNKAAKAPKNKAA